MQLSDYVNSKILSHFQENFMVNWFAALGTNPLSVRSPKSQFSSIFLLLPMGVNNKSHCSMIALIWHPTSLHTDVDTLYHYSDTLYHYSSVGAPVLLSTLVPATSA
jgi:hypothetical protein